MKNFIPFLSLLLLFACQQPEKAAEPVGQKPDAALEREMLGRIIRYIGKLPPKGATLENKFESRFDEHYARIAGEHRIDLYHRDNTTGDAYLLVSRIAPSMTVKRVATGVHLRMAGDSVAYYHEVFRTWKMPEEQLAEKSAMLFAKMVRGEALSPYYPQNSGKEEYIEFPDARTRFDTVQRIWVNQ